jgi:hypothetical protein
MLVLIMITFTTQLGLLSALQCQLLALAWSSEAPLILYTNTISLVGLMFDMASAALAFSLSTTPAERLHLNETTFRCFAKIPWAFATIGSLCFAAALHISTWAMQSPLAFIVLASTTIPLPPATIYVIYRTYAQSDHHEAAM